MAGDVDAILLHGFDCKRVDLLRRFRTCGEDFQFRVKRLEEAVSHLTAATVACA